MADIDIDCILGLDCLKANDCQVDIARYSLKIKDKICKFNLNGKIGCYRITFSETVELPARSEMMIHGNVRFSDFRKNDFGIVGPTANLYKTGQELVAKELVRTTEVIPLRILLT